MRRETRSIGFVKWWGVCLAVILAVGIIGPKAYAQEEKPWSGNINAFIGAKLLDEDDWSPVEDQFTLGVGLDFRPPNWPVSLCLDWSYSWDKHEESIAVYDPWDHLWILDVDLEGRTMEIDPGVRYIYEGLPYVRPFIGAGLAVIWAEAEGSTLGIALSEDDWGIGFWVGGGAYVTLAKHLNLGFQAKYSYAKVEIFDVKAKAGGWHVGGLVGFHW